MKRRPIMVIRMNANTDTVEFDGPAKATFDRSKLKGDQRSTYREILVDYWCKMTGNPTLYSPC